MGIIGLLEQIKNDEVVLPAIQRDFVWSEKKIAKLYDSIMRGYPIGIILLWETYNDIQYRHFVRGYRTDSLFTFHENTSKKRLKLVLDGQQRLQALFIALYGSFEGKHLYFDILSGRESDDFKEDKFLFYFLTPAKANKWNEDAIVDNQKEDKEEENDEEEENHAVKFYAKVKDLVSLSAKEKAKFKRDIKKKLNLSEDHEIRLDLNLSILKDVLTSEVNILKATVIDESKPSDSPDRKSESDVLEAFVRINKEGTPLSRSDLIFSMLKLNWKESATTLPEFAKSINEGNSFELDTDFIIRCLFVVSDLGSKFDIDILRKKQNVRKIQKNFNECCDAIRSLVDFIQNECWISSSKLLGGYYNLVPFVYYLFHAENHNVPNNEIDRIRKAIYLFGFTSPFSRYADSRLGKFIREELKPLVSNQNNTKFPLKEALYWIWRWEKIDKFGPQLVQGNAPLALHLIQRLGGAKVHYQMNMPQVDHIFPRSTLRKKKFDDALINHFANFWILAKNKNQNKSNKHPKSYFENVPASVMKRAYIDKNLLDYRRYKSFLKNREEKILKHIKKKLILSESEFDVREYWDIE